MSTTPPHLALDRDARYELAWLVATCESRGIPPARIRQLLEGAAERSRHEEHQRHLAVRARRQEAERSARAAHPARSEYDELFQRLRQLQAMPAVDRPSGEARRLTARLTELERELDAAEVS